MEAVLDLNFAPVAYSFGQEHFGACGFGDLRLTKRAIKTADLFLKHPGGTLPEKLNGEAELDGFYNFANNRKVNHANTMRGHCLRTAQQVQQCQGTVLMIHDTSEVDFSGLESVADLGPIGNGSCRGFLCHNSLAYDFESREVLGLVAQSLQCRRRVPKGETARQKQEHPQRESRLWTRNAQAVREALRQAAAQALATVAQAMQTVGQALRVVHVSDRGSDLFELLDWYARGGDLYVIRAKTNRKIVVPTAVGGRKAKLMSWAWKLPTLGHRMVSVPGCGEEPARKALVGVAAGPVQIQAPVGKRGEHGDGPLSAWVVHVREQKPPRGVAAVEWFLITNVPTATWAQANERVEWYCCRWVIEEFHKAMKTGCGVELPQFTTKKALEVTVGMLSVVATQLLRLRDLCRQEGAEQRPATGVVDVAYVEALSLWRCKRRRGDLSVREFLYALAKLGGHLNRRHDGPPGWLVLWRGWTKLQLLVEGAAGERIARCAER